MTTIGFWCIVVGLTIGFLLGFQAGYEFANKEL